MPRHPGKSRSIMNGRSAIRLRPAAKKEKTLASQGILPMERVMGIEPTTTAWKAVDACRVKPSHSAKTLILCGFSFSFPRGTSSKMGTTREFRPQFVPNCPQRPQKRSPGRCFRTRGTVHILPYPFTFGKSLFCPLQLPLSFPPQPFILRNALPTPDANKHPRPIVPGPARAHIDAAGANRYADHTDPLIFSGATIIQPKQRARSPVHAIASICITAPGSTLSAMKAPGGGLCGSVTGGRVAVSCN